MAATVTDNRTIVNEADSTSSPDTWTGSVTLSVVTTDPVPVEATGCLGQRNNATTIDAYRTATGVNFKTGTAPGPSLIYVWIFPRTIPDTKANGGVAIQLGDGTNRVAFHVGGSDESGFRHEIGPVLWQCYVLDTQKAELASDGGAQYAMTLKTGTAASLDFTAITQIGYQIKSTAAAQGNVPNCYIDIMRYSKVGQGLTITNTSGVFTDIVTEDKNTATAKAFGIIRTLATGVYGLQGVLVIGDSSGSSNTSFSMANETLVFPGFTVSTNMYQIILQQGGSGSTSVTISGSTLYCPSGIGAKFDASGSGTINLDIDNTVFFGFSEGVLFKSNHTINTTTLSNCGLVTAPGTDMRASAVLSSLVSANASALVWDVATNTDSKLDNMTFSKGANAHHAIELGTNTPDAITLRGITFTGFNASDGQNDSVILVKGTTGTIQISTVGCTGTVSFKTEGRAVTIVPDTKVLTVHTQDAASGSNISGVMVIVTAASGGPYPYQSSVGITRSVSTATVTHTGHGLSTGHQVKIEGCTQGEYNGAFTITKDDNDTYHYTVTGSPATPATGTPQSTFIILLGTTSSGDISSTARVYASAQPYSGQARYGSGVPYYKPAPFSGTISAATQTVVVQMISDD